MTTTTKLGWIVILCLLGAVALAVLANVLEAR
jgi:hypothetical protein